MLYCFYSPVDRKGGFECARCIRKMKTMSSPSRISTPSTSFMAPAGTVPNSLEESERTAALKICQKFGCVTPVYRSVSIASRFCKRHEMEEKHRNATAQKQGVGLNASSPRPFKKRNYILLSRMRI